MSYYFGAIIIGGLTIGLGLEFFSPNSIDNYSDIQVSLMVIPFGIGCAYLFYFLLKRHWKKNVVIAKEEIDDIGKDVDNFRGFK